MFGVPLYDHTNAFVGNQSVINNSTKPESTLSKKHNELPITKSERVLLLVPSILHTNKAKKTSAMFLIQSFYPHRHTTNAVQA